MILDICQADRPGIVKGHNPETQWNVPQEQSNPCLKRKQAICKGGCKN